MTIKRARRRRSESIRVKRVYEPRDDADGYRVLVDRLWPRGLTKERAGIDLWLKDVAPSHGLRRRVHGGEVSPEAFVRLYHEELALPPAADAAALLIERARKGTVTLLFAARDEAANNAVVLKEWLDARL